MRRAVLATVLLLTACGTPQEQCIRRETADLRTLESLIAETERNIQRGFGIEEYTTWEWDTYICYQPQPPGPTARFPRRSPAPARNRSHGRKRAGRHRPEPGTGELASMKQKRTELVRRANLAIEACRRAYPE